MKKKVIEILKYSTLIMETENHTDYYIDNIDEVADELVKLFAIPVVSNLLLVADIRNKLSPVKNLCTMLKNREVEPYMEKNDSLNKLVDKEIEQCLKSIKYLSNL